MTSGEQLHADVERYLLAAAANIPPPVVASDPLVLGVTPVDQWLAVLTAAANAGDAADNATSATEHSERDATLRDAASKFAAQDNEGGQELNGVGLQTHSALARGAPGGSAAGDPNAAMAQQFTLAASGIAGAVAGGLGGTLQPLGQIPQQAMQAGMGMVQQFGSAMKPPTEAARRESPLDPGLADPADADFGDLGGGGGPGGVDATGLGGLPGGTTPVSMLGPPPVPVASTAPSSAPMNQTTRPISPPAPPATPAGVGGMPMIPPSAMPAGGGSEKDGKADTRRVLAPAVRNGAPVQGRLTPPPTLPPVTKKKEEGGPVVTRRLITPRKDWDEENGAR